jgi:hypothetical protein
LKGLGSFISVKNLAQLNASIRIAGIPTIPFQRLYNFRLMDNALSLNFTDKEICFINYCRFFFGATTLSDICSASGSCLTLGIKTGRITPSLSISKFSEPYQELPGPLAWVTWRHFLLSFSDQRGILNRPLGPWLVPASKLRRHWPFLYFPFQKLLFQWQHSSYLQMHQTRHRIFNPTSSTLTIDFPSDCQPVDADQLLDGWRMSLLLQPSHTPPPPPCCTSFNDYILSLPSYERCHLLRIDLLQSSVYDIAHLLRNLDNILLVSNGGARDTYGSYGWVISASDGSRIAQGSGTVFGYDPKSYRAEISGCKAGLLFISHVFSYCHILLPPAASKSTATTKVSSKRWKNSALTALPLNPVASIRSGTCLSLSIAYSFDF